MGKKSKNEINQGKLTLEKATELVKENFSLRQRVALIIAKKTFEVIEGEDVSEKTFLNNVGKVIGRSNFLSRNSHRRRKSISKPSHPYYTPQAFTSLPIASPMAILVPVGKFIGEAVLAGFVHFLLDKGYDSVTAGEGNNGEHDCPCWRREGDEYIFDDGPGGGYLSDGSAPVIGKVSEVWNDCCEQIEGVKVSITVSFSDDSGDIWENATGVRRIEASAHEIVDRESDEVNTKQIDAHLFKANDDDDITGEDGIAKKVLVGCIPCGFINEDGKVLITIKLTDWNGNIRIKKQTLEVPNYQLRECC